MQAALHFTKARQVFCRGAAAKGAVHAGFAEVTAAEAHLLGRLFVDIGVAGFDQVLGRAVHEVEVVAGLVRFVVARLAPVKAQPLHRFDDAVDVLGVFFFRVGVVKAQVAHAAIVACQAEVDADAFGVANVQVAVGLGREAGADFGGVGLACRVGVIAGILGGAFVRFYAWKQAVVRTDTL